MATTHFLVHDDSDTVGVIVVEGVSAGDKLTGWRMESDDTIEIEALDPIPIGHKIALGDIKNGDTIIKYGADIGKAIADIPLGRHAHVSNVKTKRW